MGHAEAQQYRLQLPAVPDQDTDGNAVGHAYVDCFSYAFANTYAHRHAYADANANCFANTDEHATTTPTATPTASATPSPTPTVTPSPTVTPTPTSIYAEIRGVVWFDLNSDRVKSLYEPGLIGVQVRLLQEGVQIGTMTTGGGGAYSFTLLPPGRYRVREVQPEQLRFSTTPNEVMIDIAAGETHTVDFGDWAGRSTYLPLILR